VDRQLSKIMAQADAQLTPGASAYFYAIARRLVASSGSLAIVDPINGKAVLNDGVIWRPFKPVIRHGLVVITSRDQPLGLAGSRMLNQIRETLAVLSAP